MNKYIFLVLGIILLIGSVSAWSNNTLFTGFCYQEFSNQSTSCGGLSNGNYSINDLWNDGNWSTGQSMGIETRQVIYFKPNNATREGTLWQVKSGNSPTKNENVSIIDSCWNYNNNYLILRWNRAFSYSSYDCYNGSWIELGRPANGYNTIYEEAMNWNIGYSDSGNLTFTGNQNITKYLSVPQNTIITNGFLNLSNQSTLNISGNNYTLSIGNINVWNQTTGMSITNVTVDDGVTIGAIGSPNSAKYGVKIVPSQNFTMVGAWKNSASTATKAYIQSGDGLTTYKTVDFVGNFALFNFNIGTNDTYRITSDANGGNAALAGNTGITTPLLTSYFSITKGINGGSEQDNQIFTWDNYTVSETVSQPNVNERTSNLANAINNYLSSCTISNGFCLVPFIFHSDTTGILQYSNLIFNNIGFIENSQTYNATTYETSKEGFYINLTYDSVNYPVITGDLYYNGTYYPATKTGSGNNAIFFTSLDIPFISASPSVRTFNWRIGLTNTSGTTYINSSSKTQTVYNISLGDCSGENTVKVLNISTYDQDTLAPISQWTFQATINYFTGNSSLYKTATFNNVNISTKGICTNLNATFKLNGLIEFSAAGYAPSTYYFVNTPVSNDTTNLGLGLLNTASTQNVNYIIQLVDQTNMPVPGYFVYVNRCYASNSTNCTTVQVIQTDTNGKSVAFLEVYSVFYQFVVKDPNGNTVYTSDIRKIALESSPYTITLTIGSSLPNPLNYIGNLTGLTYNGPTYDQSTGLVTLTYTDINSSFVYANMLIYNLNASGQNALVCNVSVYNANGVMICNMSGNSTSTYSAQFYVNRGGNSIFITNNMFDISSIASTAGALGIFGGFIIILICAFAFAFNEVAGIISVNLAIIFVQFIGLIQFGIIPITAIIGISILILVVLERG